MEPVESGMNERFPPPRKRWGQNFLVDPSAIERIVDALAPEPGDAVLEIGPGRGALTASLIERAGRIVAVELDPELARLLRERFGEERLVLEAGDILRIDLARVAERLGASPDTPLAVVGNLPYGISKPVASMLVRERAHVGRAVLMFQKEVADRIVAAPNTEAYGPLGILVGEAFRVERVMILAPGAFRPSPKVRSSVMKWVRRPAEDFPQEAEAPLRAVLAASFAHRRQTLSKNLRAALPGGEPAARELLAAAFVDGSLRAEALVPAAFRRLAALWRMRA